MLWLGIGMAIYGIGMALEWCWCGMVLYSFGMVLARYLYGIGICAVFS